MPPVRRFLTPIYIPTYRRERVLTYESLPPLLRRRVVFACGRGDGGRLSVLCPAAQVWETDQQGRGAVAVKEAIYRRAADWKYKICIMLDDDLVFETAVWEDGKKRFRRAADVDVIESVRRLEERAHGDGVGFTSFSTPFFNDHKDDWVMNKRMVHGMFINVAECRRVGATFAGIPTMSDVKFSLECYTAGLCSWTLTTAAAIDRSRRGSGGESAAIDRPARFAEAVRYLTNRWPRYVRVRDASKNRAHQESIGYPQDITFYPGRAYRDARVGTEDEGRRG